MKTLSMTVLKLNWERPLQTWTTKLLYEFLRQTYEKVAFFCFVGFFNMMQGSSYLLLLSSWDFFLCFSDCFVLLLFVNFFPSNVVIVEMKKAVT